MPFGLRTHVGPKNHVLYRSPGLPTGRGNIEGEGRPIVKYRDTAVSCAKNGLTDRDAVWVVGLDWLKESCSR